jgi:hypothetical protein
MHCTLGYALEALQSTAKAGTNFFLGILVSHTIVSSRNRYGFFVDRGKIACF